MKLGTVCTGIGSPEVALEQLSIEYGFELQNIFACDIDKYARASYSANFTPHKMFTDMTSEEFHNDSEYCDIFVGGIPCQAFSLAGKRLGELDKRGLLFYDFYRYVKEKKPKVFIIENVKGLLSDNKGKTFSNWIHLLARSVNQQEINFPHPDSLGYNLHHTVLNSKNFGVPQNRERVFIVGIRSDLPNDFRFPIGWKLDKRLKDILETHVDEKYYLSDKMIDGFIKHTADSIDKSRGFKFSPITEPKEEIASCVTARCYKMGVDDNYIQIKEATSKGFDVAEPGDSINYSNPNSKTRRGRVGKQIANTLDTACNQAVFEPICVAMRGRNPENPSDRTPGAKTEQRFEPNSQGITNTITSVQKDNLILEGNLRGGKWDKTHEQNGRVYGVEGISPTVTTMGGGNQEIKALFNSKIRRLTPLECWRLQAFPDENFYKAKEVNSDTQLYKQAGNSMTSSVMKAIIKNLLKILR